MHPIFLMGHEFGGWGVGGGILMMDSFRTNTQLLSSRDIN